MANEVIIAAAVVGAEVTREQSPHVPYTPAEIAGAAVDAGRAGAAVVHLHARWPDGRPSQEAVHFREIVDRIRAAGSDVVVQCSTGGAVGMSDDERLGSLVDGAEMGTLNLGTMNFGDDVFVNTRPDVVKVAARLREKGLVPECEVYDAGMLDTLRWLKQGGVDVRVFNVGADGKYFFFVLPGSYAIAASKGASNAPEVPVTLTQPTEVIRRDITIP